jgi:hypothetical protein
LRLLQPSGAHIPAYVKGRDIGFDVQQRGFVHHIHIQDVNDATIDPVQANDGQADGIGAAWGASGEKTPPHRVQKRLDHQAVSFGKMEMVKQDQMGKAVEIAQSFLVLGVQNQSAGYITCA